MLKHDWVPVDKYSFSLNLSFHKKIIEIHDIKKL